MPIHVILQFDDQEQALAALGQVEACHVVEWFDDDLVSRDEEAVDHAWLAAEVEAARSA